MDFSILIRYNQRSNQVKIAFLIDSQITWTKISISFFISARSEFYLGQALLGKKLLT